MTDRNLIKTEFRGAGFDADGNITATYTLTYDDGSIDIVSLNDCENPFKDLDHLVINEDPNGMSFRFSDRPYDRAHMFKFKSKVTQKYKTADPIELTWKEIEERIGRPVKLKKDKGKDADEDWTEWDFYE